MEDREILHPPGTFVEAHRLAGLTRRRFIKIGLLTAIAAAVSPMNATEAAIRGLVPSRRLSIFNTHTEEMLEICYCRNGAYRPEAMRQINHLLRDHRTGDIEAIKARLLDVLYALSRTLDTSEPYHIISGYRSPATNSMLRRNSRRVARRSFHTLGMAVDIRVPGLDTKCLHSKALKLRAGGVGYYPESDFIHLDCGPIRHW